MSKICYDKSINNDVKFNNKRGCRGKICRKRMFFLHNYLHVAQSDNVFKNWNKCNYKDRVIVARFLFFNEFIDSYFLFILIVLRYNMLKTELHLMIKVFQNRNLLIQQTVKANKIFLRLCIYRFLMNSLNLCKLDIRFENKF